MFKLSDTKRLLDVLEQLSLMELLQATMVDHYKVCIDEIHSLTWWFNIWNGIYTPTWPLNLPP